MKYNKATDKGDEVALRIIRKSLTALGHVICRLRMETGVALSSGERLVDGVKGLARSAEVELALDALAVEAGICYGYDSLLLRMQYFFWLLTLKDLSTDGKISGCFYLIKGFENRILGLTLQAALGELDDIERLVCIHEAIADTVAHGGINEILVETQWMRDEPIPMIQVNIQSMGIPLAYFPGDMKESAPRLLADDDGEDGADND